MNFTRVLMLCGLFVAAVEADFAPIFQKFGGILDARKDFLTTVVDEVSTSLSNMVDSAINLLNPKALEQTAGKLTDAIKDIPPQLESSLKQINPITEKVKRVSKTETAGQLSATIDQIDKDQTSNEGQTLEVLGEAETSQTAEQESEKEAAPTPNDPDETQDDRSKTQTDESAEGQKIL